jgi:hypothetical protein
MDTTPPNGLSASTTFFELTHGSLFILHPDDERPYLRPDRKMKTFHMHGGIHYGGDERISLGMIFRSTSSIDTFHKVSNHVKILAEDKAKCHEKDAILKDRLLTDGEELTARHRSMKERYKDMRKKFKAK